MIDPSYHSALKTAISVLTVVSIYLAGSRSIFAWILSLFNQALWSIWIFSSPNTEFIPMNLALWVVYLRNYVRWKLGDDVSLRSRLKQKLVDIGWWPVST